MPMPRLALFALGFVFVVGLAACGSASPASSAVDDGDPGPDPDPVNGAVLYADSGCDVCHGEDGSGGFGPDLRCYPADGLVVYAGVAGTPHTGGVAASLDDAEAAAMARFLGAAACASNVPASHTVPMGSSGVLHHEGLATPDTSCTPCHGPALEGYGTVPSCASCHGEDGGDVGCTTCHASVQDDQDGLPADGRRAVTGEFTLASHHVSGSVTNADCIVCHEMGAHKQGTVRLRDVDDPTVVITLTGNPFTSALQAARLETFCLACHDADGADGQAPFSDGVMPPVVDATRWAASAHAGQLTCAGNGTTIGCHDSGHGSPHHALLAARYVVADPHTRVDGDYAACWTCHGKNTILFGLDAFGSRHETHVVEERTACAVCHGVHGSHDATERGQIDFTRALTKGWLTLSTGTTLSSAFVATSSGGTCALRCHGEGHGPEGYGAGAQDDD